MVSALVVVPACYEPDLTNCAVTCAADNECVGDQRCTSGWCSASGVACSALGVVIDAAVDSGETLDAPPTTVDAMIDGPPAPTTVALRVEIQAQGQVRIVGIGDCTHVESPCQFTVPVGARDFVAIPTRIDKPFEQWTSTTCSGQDETCTANLTTATTVSAKFH